MLALLRNFPVKDKGNTVGKNLMSSSLCYVICYTTASVWTEIGDTVRWFLTERSGRPLFWV